MANEPDETKREASGAEVGAGEAGTAAVSSATAAVRDGNGDGRPVVLSTHGLTKQFKDVRAVDGLDIVVHAGDVYGFLGPNGAGKTTVIRMVLGLIRPTNGHVEVMGNRVPGKRECALRHIGGFVDDPVFYANMSARRNLWLLGQMSAAGQGHGDAACAPAKVRISKERIDEVLEIVGLADRAQSKVGGFSHGMKQRLGIAQALLHRPDLIVLDEPTSGLDPGGMKDVRELIRELGRMGTTVFLSSHLLHEVELVCTRAAIVNRGRVIVEGPVSELRPDGMAVKVLVSDRARAGEVLRTLPGPPAFSEDGDHLIVTMPDDQVPELVRRLVGADVDVRAVVPAPERGLEDVFLELTGEDDAARAGAVPRRGMLAALRRGGRQ
jgi:ABC-2 type transport system ATP-binding protein